MLCLTGVACTGGGDRHAEIRAIHDEIMPRRGALVKLERKLARDSNHTARESLALRRLERADDAMMAWMHSEVAYATLRDSLDSDALAAYLDRREREIRAVGDSMEASIRFAEQVTAP